MNTSKQIMIIVSLLFLSLLATGAYTMWDPSRAEHATERQTETAVWRGAFLFSQNCIACHGDAGEGGQRSNRLREAPPLNRPDLQGREELGGEVSKPDRDAAYDMIFNTLVCGRVGKAMPTWGIEHGGVLNDEQIRQLTLLITEGTGWEDTVEFALHGFPEGDVHGYADVPFELEQPISEDDTEIALSDVSTVSAGERLQFGDELMLITAVTPDESRREGSTVPGNVTVERGLGTTAPAAHDLEAELLKPPVPPDPAPITGAACGQFPQAVATAAPEPPRANLEIKSEGIAWDKSELYALPDVPLTLTHNHNDPGQQHNWALYPTEEDAINGANLIATTDIEGGPTIQILNFGPLAVGEYYYQCDVHPNMAGFLFVQEAGAGGEAPAEGAPADGGAATDATVVPEPTGAPDAAPEDGAAGEPEATAP